ncbi:MAG: hypothetical protein M1812_001933 [Candelaria pacifica]|nr:MAG: hypothetical protein M1812_001933 [Candelaria pacifica]
MHISINLLSALTAIVATVNANVHIQAIQPNSPHPIKYEADLSWSKCTSFQSIWQNTKERVDEMHFSNTGDYHIIFYRQADCKGAEVGYIADANMKVYQPLSVAMTEQGTNKPKSLDKLHFDNGKTPDDYAEYPSGKDVFAEMKAFMVEPSMCRGSATWSLGNFPACKAPGTN